MRRFAAVVGATVLAAGLFVVAAPAAGAETFTEPGTFPVPAGVCQVTIAAWGGSGEDGEESNGGSSGRIQADFAGLKPGDVLTVTPGQRGSFGGGGFNGGGTSSAGVGGGSSAVELNNVPLIIAAGGGGGSDLGDAGGGRGGIGLANGEAGDQGANPGGAGGAAQGAPGNGGPGVGIAGGGGGGAGAAPGGGGNDSGGGGGGNSVSSSATNVTDPGSLQGPGGEVRITAGAPGVGCTGGDDDDDDDDDERKAADDDERKAAPVAQPISAAPAFTG